MCIVQLCMRFMDSTYESIKWSHVNMVVKETYMYAEFLITSFVRILRRKSQKI